MPPKLRVVAPNSAHERRFKSDISTNLANVLRTKPLVTPQEAMWKVTTEMLANNPFNPPSDGKCPINDLPNELLAYIFKVGHEMEEEEGADDDDDVDYIDQHTIEYPGDSDDDGFRLAKPLKKGPVLRLGEDEEIIDDADDGDNEDWEDEESAEESDDSDGEDDDSDDEDFEVESVLPFQILASHVCRHWREVALQSHTLWTALEFVAPARFDKLEAYIQRSEGLPLDIFIDCTIPDGETEEDHPSHPDHVHEYDDDDEDGDEDHECGEPTFFSRDELAKILDLVIPHVARWRLFEFSASFYPYVYATLTRLAECPAAPLLEIFQLYHYEDCEDYDIFTPAELNTRFVPFHGIAPNLTHVSLWGVHVDWEASVSYLRGLQDFELAYHAHDVRPSYKTFLEILDNCPDLETLTLCLSGPALGTPLLADSDEEWGPHAHEIPSLKDLVLCYHPPPYATALMQHLDVPNVTQLALAFDEQDYSEFVVKALAKPIRGKTKSLLAQLEHMKISGLPLDNKAVEMLLDQLAGLLTLNINCSEEAEQAIFDKMGAQKDPLEAGSSAAPAEGHASAKAYCPLLHTISTTGVDGARMKKFVEARRAAGVPLKKVLMCDRDEISAKQEKWLKDNLESLEFFEPSDSEEEIDVEIDDEEGDEDDDDQEEPPSLMNLD